MFDPYFCSPPPPHSLPRSGMRKPAGLPKLSAPSQERFLSYSEFLAQQGAARLLGLLRGACEGALASVQLQEALTPPQLAALMQRIADAMAAAVQQAAGSRSWAAFLLPGPEELREGLAPRAPDNRAFMLGGEALVVDAEVVMALADEAEAVAAGDEFAAALQVWSGLACMACGWRHGAKVQRVAQPSQAYFAYLCSSVQKLATLHPFAHCCPGLVRRGAACSGRPAGSQLWRRVCGAAAGQGCASGGGTGPGPAVTSGAAAPGPAGGGAQPVGPSVWLLLL